MSLSVWIVLGIASGFIASKIINWRGDGLFLHIVLGVVGAVTAGTLFSTSGMAEVESANVYSFVVPVVGAIGALVTYHFLIHGSLGRRR